MDKFLDSVKPPNLNQEVNSLNRHITNENIETVINNLPKTTMCRWNHKGILLGVKRPTANLF